MRDFATIAVFIKNDKLSSILPPGLKHVTLIQRGSLLWYVVTHYKFYSDILSDVGNFHKQQKVDK